MEPEELITLFERINNNTKKVKLFDSNVKKIFVIFTISIVVTALVAMEYLRTKSGYEYGVTTFSPHIKWISRGQCLDVNHTGLIIRSYDNQTYKLELGNWTVNSQRIYPCAFGIVNEENYHLTLLEIEVSGNISQYIRVWLHANPRLLCNSTIGGVDGTESSENMTLMWNYTNGTSGNYWILCRGDGNASTYKVEYPLNTATTYSCVWNESYNVWLWNENERGVARNNSLLTDTVWVEIDIDIPQFTPIGYLTGTLIFYLASVGDVEVSL